MATSSSFRCLAKRGEGRCVALSVSSSAFTLTPRAAAVALFLALAAVCHLRTAELTAAPRHPDAAPLRARSGLPVPECKDKKIAILDIEQYAGSHNFSRCSLDNVVNWRDGVAYLSTERERLQQFAADHNFGQNAQPWYLQQAVRRSRYFTEDLDEADIVLVDDYCYYIWWLATVHTLGRELSETPGDSLLAGYRAMMETPRWARRHGEDFVFYDSHPGFAAGTSANPYRDVKCNDLRNSVNLIMDIPMRYVCGQGWPYNKLLVSPYNPNRADLSSSERTIKERSLLLFHWSACAPLDAAFNNFNAGKVMRREMAKALVKEDPDVKVKCTNHDFAEEDGGAQPLDFKEMFEQMQRSIFCLVMPGDAASTRRLSEIMTAGCIPVFIGPPYHSMPLVEDIDYRDAAVFFNVADHSLWLEAEMQAARDMNERAEHETEARWWVADADISDRSIAVSSVADIVPFLRTLSHEELQKKLALMASMQRAFSFLPRLSKPPNAVNVLLSGICKRAPLEPITA